MSTAYLWRDNVLFFINGEAVQQLEFSLLQNTLLETADGSKDLKTWRELPEETRGEIVMDAVFGAINTERALRVFREGFEKEREKAA